MTIGDFGAVLDSEAFVQAASQPPILRKRTKNVVLLMSSNPVNVLAHLRSIAISDAGLINTTPLSSLDLDTVAGRDMGLLHWLDDVFVAYLNDQNANSWLWTVACDDAGAITDPARDTLAVGQGSNITRRSDLIKPHDGILLTGPSYPYPGVHLQTITISDAGIMPGPVDDSMDVPVRPRIQRLRQAAGDRIISLSSILTEFYIDSFTCTDAGVLPAAPSDSWGPIVIATDHTSLCKISDTVFAVFCMDADSSINIRTFSINADGTINKAWLDEEQVEAAASAHTHMMEMGAGYFVLVYNMVTPNWRLRTCSIAVDGTITLLDSKDLVSGNRGNPWFEHLTGDIWTLTYEDVAQSVRIDTIEISTPAAAGNVSLHELMVGIGP